MLDTFEADKDVENHSGHFILVDVLLKQKVAERKSNFVYSHLVITITDKILLP